MVSQPWSLILVIICALQISVMTKVKPHNEACKITSLPGQPKVSFLQYSGYMNVDEKQNRYYFYYFVEAETNDPTSKPLVLWLNGGPGCSSIGAGAFTENGPFKPSGSVLVQNKYSWNKEANMLYLESPAGVGFSYSANKSFYESVNDEMTARDNLVFLEKWFDKFPEFKNGEFYITGESYAGHYVPQLVNLIIQSKVTFNLKGIAIGNPLLEFNTDLNSRAEFLSFHGIISDYMYNQLTFVCNYSQIRRQSQTGELTTDCVRVKQQVISEISNHVDMYDVTLDVCLSSVLLQSKILNQLQDEQKIDVCVEDETNVYLNRKDVQKAFHASLVGVDNWTMCSDVVKYDMQNLELPTIGLLGSLVKCGIRVLVYSGDQDSVIPLIGTRTLVNDLARDLKLNTTRPYSAWIVENQVTSYKYYLERLVAGHKSMIITLSFATIRGASHEAPFTQPKKALVMFTAFLSGKPLPPVNVTK